jgi:RNA polymerase sigma-70 factor (ECF subfamily)
MADAGEGKGTRPGLRLLRGEAESAREDDGLVRAFLAGDDDAFGELVRRHERTVLALVRRYAGAEDDARDLAQRAFLRAFEAAKRSTSRSFLRVGPVIPSVARPLGRAKSRDAQGERGKVIPFRAWLYRIAVNLGKNHARDARRWRRAPVEDAERAVEVLPPGSAALEREERARAVRAAVVKLPRRQREVLTLRIDAELSFAQIAETLRITENNAKVHFHHAAKRLKAIVAEEGVES